MLKILTKDEVILAAGLLHDTIEDTDTTYDELVQHFGQKVADLVMEVTQEGKKDEYGYYFPRLHSTEGVLIKLVDRSSNLSRMQAWDAKRRETYTRKSIFVKTKGPNEP